MLFSSSLHCIPLHGCAAFQLKGLMKKCFLLLSLPSSWPRLFLPAAKRRHFFKPLPLFLHSAVWKCHVPLSLLLFVLKCRRGLPAAPSSLLELFWESFCQASACKDHACYGFICQKPVPCTLCTISWIRACLKNKWEWFNWNFSPGHSFQHCSCLLIMNSPLLPKSRLCRYLRQNSQQKPLPFNRHYVGIFQYLPFLPTFSLF